MQHMMQSASGAGTVSSCLVVDDDTFDRHMIKRCVGRERPDLRVFECATLAEARQFLGKSQADLILLDNRLPDGLGSQFAQGLRSDHRMVEAAIFVLTSDDPRQLDCGVTTLSKDRLSSRTIWDLVDAFLVERAILRSTDHGKLVADFSVQLGEDLAPGMSRMLRTLRMARARVARPDPQKAVDELDKLEEMLLAMSEVLCGERLR